MASKKKAPKKKAFALKPQTGFDADKMERGAVNQLFYRWTGSQASDASIKTNGETFINTTYKGMVNHVLGGGDAKKVVDQGAGWGMIEAAGGSRMLKEALQEVYDGGKKGLDMRTLMNPGQDGRGSKFFQGISALNEIIVMGGIGNRVYESRKIPADQMKGLTQIAGREQFRKELSEFYA